MGYVIKAYSPGGALMHTVTSGDLFMVRGHVSDFRSKGLGVIVTDSNGSVIPL